MNDDKDKDQDQKKPKDDFVFTPEERRMLRELYAELPVEALIKLLEELSYTDEEKLK